jgi:hypothetical protein
MRRLTLFISIALAVLAVAIPAASGARKGHHHKRTHHARVADRNHNGMPDRWERRHHVRKAAADPDRDGVANLGEFHNATNPRDADTDDDGIKDGDDDANHDGVDDGDEQSGVIASFENGTLTVTLVNGDTLRGSVTDATEIECESTTTAAARHDGDSGETESGDDNSGPGSGESGDDNSGPGSTTSGSGDDDQGDDNDDQGEDEHNCGTDALTQGTIVREAELRLTSAGAVFREIELGGKAPA